MTWSFASLQSIVQHDSIMEHTAWCSEIGPLRSQDAPELHASHDVGEPISLHQAVEDDILSKIREKKRCNTLLSSVLEYPW